MPSTIEIPDRRRSSGALEVSHRSRKLLGVGVRGRRRIRRKRHKAELNGHLCFVDQRQQQPSQGTDRLGSGPPGPLGSGCHRYLTVRAQPDVIRVGYDAGLPRLCPAHEVGHFLDDRDGLVPFEPQTASHQARELHGFAADG
jgi:hypothetical protein